MKHTWLVLLPLVFLVSASNSYASFTMVTYNAKHLGRKNLDIMRFANMLSGADFAAIQEVNTGEAGAKAVAQVAQELENATHAKFCFALSEIPSDASERYAALWREDRLSYVTQSGKELTECPKFAITLRLGAKHADKILREPAVGTFKEKSTGAKFWIGIVHLVPTAKHPENEIEPLFDTMASLPGKFAKILMGDFNLAADHKSLMAASTRGFEAALAGEIKTSLKAKIKGFSKAYDNIFYRDCGISDARVANPYEKHPDLTPQQVYQQLSDHAPVFATVTLSSVNPK